MAASIADPECALLSDLLSKVISSPSRYGFLIGAMTAHLQETGFASKLGSIMFNDESTADVVVIINGTEIKCHRFALESASGYFNTLLNNKVFTETGNEIARVTLAEIDVDTFLMLKAYMYGTNIGRYTDYKYDAMFAAKISLMDNAKLFDLLVAANRLLITGFRKFIPLTLQNCLTILDASIYVGDAALGEMCSPFINRKFKDIPVEHWLGISIECIIYLTLTHMKSQMKFGYQYSNYLVERIISWFAHDADNRIQHIDQLTKHEIVGVLFRLVDPPNTVNAVETQIVQQLFRK